VTKNEPHIFLPCHLLAATTSLIVGPKNVVTNKGSVYVNNFRYPLTVKQTKEWPNSEGEFHVSFFLVDRDNRIEPYTAAESPTAFLTHMEIGLVFIRVIRAIRGSPTSMDHRVSL
jgi:hypothetical protein